MSEDTKGCDYNHMEAMIKEVDAQRKIIEDGTNRKRIEQILEMLIKNPSGVWIDEEKNTMWKIGIRESDEEKSKNREETEQN